MTRKQTNVDFIQRMLEAGGIEIEPFERNGSQIWLLRVNQEYYIKMFWSGHKRCPQLHHYHNRSGREYPFLPSNSSLPPDINYYDVSKWIPYWRETLSETAANGAFANNFGLLVKLTAALQ